MVHTRNISVADTSERSSSRYINDYGRKFMVMVGINRYQGESSSLPDLQTPIPDICRIFRILRDHFGFEGHLLAERQEVVKFEAKHQTPDSLEPYIAGNGTCIDIVQLLWDLANQARPEDLLLFYYGGHGIEENGMGFLLPYGTVRGRYDTYLMYPTLFGAFESIPCLHKLLFFDCCFAGVVTRSAGAAISNSRAEENADRKASFPGESEESIAAKVMLEPVMASFASTTAADLAPDQFPTRQNALQNVSEHSPFADTLAEKLEQIPTGSFVTPGEISSTLHTGISQRVSKVQNIQGNSVPLTPVHKLVGSAIILLKKTGIRLIVPDNIYVRQDEHKQLPVTLSGATPEDNITIKTTPETEAIKRHNETFIIDGSKLLPGETSITVQVCNENNIQTWKTVRLFRQTDIVEPLVLETEVLPPCLTETDYRAKIQLSGGIPPLSFAIERLPKGLDLSDSGEVYGRVSRELATGGGYLAVTCLTVKDGNQQKLRERLAIPLIDPNLYLAIPSGEFKYGYIPSPQRSQTLTKINPQGIFPKKLCYEFPAGETAIPSYYMRRRPVTNSEWQDFASQTNCAGFPTRWESEDDPNFLSRESMMPVTGLNGADVQAYCQWRETCLPSRFQWEKACRGTDGRLFPWGDVFKSHLCNCNEQHGASYDPLLIKQQPELFLSRADQYPQGASPYGIEDLTGNVWELTRQFLQDHHKQPHHARVGGSVAEGGINLAACFGGRLKNAVAAELNPDGDGVRLHPGLLPPLTGFRDVIELAEAPTYRQGFVKLTCSTLKIEGTHVHLPCDAYIARYEVSNNEYAEFVRARNYQLPSHWSRDDEWFFSFQKRYHPVVNVTYEDVEAFCEWKSIKLGVSCMPLNESIWRLAVHSSPNGGAPRNYPWGDEYKSGFCNHPDSGFGGTVPVFHLAAGRAPCGAWNLVGNTAEWVGANKVAGGSWRQGISAPAQFVIKAPETSTDLGFRYFSYDPPV